MDTAIDIIEQKGVKMKLSAKAVVKQHNALISAKHSLTPLQMKIICAVIGKLSEKDEDFKEYVFSIKDFFMISGPGNYKFFTESVKGILSKPLEIKTESGELLQCNWLAGAKSKAGVSKIRFHPDLKPYLLQLKQQFTVLKLEYILALDSIYSIRIYELLKQFEKLGFRQMELDELRWILEIPNSYKVSNIRIILDKAREEIALKTDISFTYKFIKFGIKFGWVKFTIREKKKGSTPIARRRKQALGEREEDTQTRQKESGSKEDKKEEPEPKKMAQKQAEEAPKELTDEEKAKRCYKQYQITKKCDLKSDKSFKAEYCKYCTLGIVAFLNELKKEGY